MLPFSGRLFIVTFLTIKLYTNVVIYVEPLLKLEFGRLNVTLTFVHSCEIMTSLNVNNKVQVIQHNPY